MTEMDLWKRGFLKLLSAFETNISEDYPRLRRGQEVLQSIGAGKYDFADWEIEHPAGEAIPVRIFPYEANDTLPGLIIFIHGGGWVTGSIDSYTRICGLISENLKRPVCSIDYRLAPEHPYPAGLDDCYVVVQRIFNHAEHMNLRAHEIILCGDSAGANLCAALAIRAMEEGAFEIAQQILLYPTVAGDYHNPQTLERFPSLLQFGEGYGLSLNQLYDYIDLYQPEEALRTHPYVAPIHGPTDHVSGRRLPDTLVITAEFDILRDEGEAYADKLIDAGIPTVRYRVSETIHGFLALPAQVRPVQMALNEMEMFLEQTSKKHRTDQESLVSIEALQDGVDSLR